MSRPAARIGDRTAHGGTIIRGCASVLIGGRPAARVGDDHTCPEGGHRGGPILPPGAPRVMIEGKAVARRGDRLLCGGGSHDVITSGEDTVLIGS